MKILSFGEIIWDVYPQKKCIGGAPLNFAAHAAREGAEAYLLSAVGNDTLGAEALDIIKEHGVDTSLVHTADGLPTGQCTVTLSDSGVPSYRIEENTAYDHIPFADGAADIGFDAFVFGTLALRGEHNRKTVRELLKKNVAREVFVDLNLRKPFYSKKNIILGLENATILKVSDEELPAVMQMAFGTETDSEGSIGIIAEKYKNIKLIILTCGADGSVAYDLCNGETHRCAIEKVSVVSTVGAGDSFGAAFLVNYLSGKSIPCCLERAAHVSALVVSRAEALPPLNK